MGFLIGSETQQFIGVILSPRAILRKSITKPIFYSIVIGKLVLVLLIDRDRWIWLILYEN